MSSRFSFDETTPELKESLSPNPGEEEHLREAADEFRRRLIENGEQETRANFDPSRIAAVLRLLRATMGDHSTRSMRSANRRELPVDLPQRVGRFVMGELVGRGGFGVVHRAHDEVLHRDVAIKVILKSVIGQSLKDEDRVREARAAAKLNHPYLVPLYEVLDDDEHLYLVSEFCEGPTLYQFLADFPYGLPPRQGVEIAVKLGQAVAHAHGRGLAHRDIKPGNVILPNDDESVDEPTTIVERTETLPFTPRLTDFGLVLDLDSDRDLGREGRITGTILYMAPEQIMGTAGIDARLGDIYSLGLLLHQMLTGRLPHRADSTLTLLEDTCTNEVTEIRPSQGEISRDLEAVCLKALRKNPAERYGSVKQFVDDLIRWQEGREVTARRQRLWERGYRFAAASPVTAALFVSLAAMTLLSSIYFAASNHRLSQQSRELTQAVRSAKAAESKAIEVAYRSDINQAFSALAKQNAASAMARASEMEGYVHDAWKGRFDLRVLKALSQDGWFEVDQFDSPIEEIVAIPATDHFAVAAKGCEVRIYSGSDGTLVETLKVPKDSHVHALAVSSSGSELAVGVAIPADYFWLSDGAEVRLFSNKNTEGVFEPTGKVLTGFAATIDALAFSGDDKHLAVGTRYEPLHVFDLASDSTPIRLPSTRRNEDLAFAQTSDKLGSELMWMPETNEIRLFDIETASIRHQVSIDPNYFFRRISRSHDGRFVVATKHSRSDGFLFRIPDDRGGSEQVEQFKLKNTHGELRSIRVSREGRYVVAGTMGGGVVLWDLQAHFMANGKTVSEPARSIEAVKYRVIHREPVIAVDVNPEGRIVSGSEDGCVAYWHAEVDRESEICVALENQSRAADLAPDGSAVIMGCIDGSVWHYEISSGHRIQLRAADEKRITYLAISPNGAIVTVGCSDGTVMFARRKRLLGVKEESMLESSGWGDIDWTELPRLEELTDLSLAAKTEVARIRYTPSSQYVCLCRGSNHVQWVGLTRPTPEVYPNYHAPTSVQDICILDEERAMTLGDSIRYVDRKQRSAGDSVPGLSYTNCQVFDRANSTIYVGGMDGRIRTINPDGETLKTSRRWSPGNGEVAGNQGITAIVLSPDGANLLTGSDSGDVAIWDTASLRFLGRVWKSEQFGHIERLRVSADGTVIMAHECFMHSVRKQTKGRVRLLRLPIGNNFERN